jgi:Cysteine-rich CPXCG
MIETIVIHCPYCGEGFETVADVSAGAQQYTEDCAVCCRPIDVSLSVDDEGNLQDVRTKTDRE